MARNRSGAGAAAGFIISSVLSIAAGIASVVMMFLKWVVVDPLGGEQYSIMEFRKMALNLKELLTGFQEVLSNAGVAFHLSGFDQFEMITLGILAAVVVVILLQAVYVIAVITGRGWSRGFGILTGILTFLFAAATIVLFYWMNGQINALFVNVNQLLDSVNQTLSGLQDILSTYLPSLQGMESEINLNLDANRLFHMTAFPFITGVLGLLEAIFAR